MGRNLVEMILATYPPELRSALVAKFGNDVMQRIENAMMAGREAGTPELINQFNAALDSGDNVALEAAMGAAKAALGTRMDDIKEAFGSDYDAMEQVMIAHRMGHLIDGQDMYVVVVDALLTQMAAIPGLKAEIV